MNGTSTCFKFPCAFPVKIMGLNTGEFEQSVRVIVSRHAGGAPVEFANQLSSGGKYLSITATFTATSKEQLDALYRELNAHELIVMTL
jgi:putative lipoic acid-binding regulatory protein